MEQESLDVEYSLCMFLSSCAWFDLSSIIIDHVSEIHLTHLKASIPLNAVKFCEIIITITVEKPIDMYNH